MADKSVVYRLRAEIGDFKSKIASAGSSLRELAKDAAGLDAKSAKLRAGMTHLGDTAGKVGLVAAGGLALTVKAAMDWESAWAGVQKTVNGSAAEMAVLEEELRRLAQTLPASHAEIAAVAEAAGQLGVQREAVAKFTETMINLGETTNLSAEEAATALARIGNIMGTSQMDVDRMGATIVELGNNSATTEREIVELATRLAAAGKQAGLVESDLFAIASTLTSVGVEAEAGGTAMSKVFTSIADAVRDGGENLETFAEVAGVTTEEFQRAFAEDGAAAIGMFVEGMGSLSAAGESTSKVFKDLGLTDQRLMRAILSAGSATGMWADQLEMAGGAWDQNTALAIEAAKRYETTASQMQIAWNNVNDAMIEFGEVALPVLADGAEKVAGFARAVADLPGPVKAASTSLLGITAVVGGGLWFTAKTINGIHDMRSALDNLGVSGDKTAGKLGKAAKAAGVAGAVIAAAMVVDDIVTSTDKAAIGVEKTTRALLALGDASAAAEAAADLDRLGDSVDRLIDKEWNEATDDWLRDKIPGFGDAADLKEATADVEALDRALVALVAGGGPELAAQKLAELGEARGWSTDQMEQLLKQLPDYEEALLAEENAAELAAGATDEYGNSLEGTGDAADGAGDSIEDLIEAMREQRAEALRAENALLNWESSLLDVRDAAKEHAGVLTKNGDLLNGQRRAGIEARKELVNLAAAWNDLSDEEKNSAGTRRRTIDGFVAAAVAMGMSEEAARAYARELMEIPPKRTTKIEADTAEADNRIETTKGKISTLDRMRANPQVAVGLVGVEAAEQRLSWLARQRSATIYTYTKGSGAGPLREADGGYISGPGGPRDDIIPALLSNGEYVVNAAATAKHRALLEAINAHRYADGGYIGRSVYPASVSVQVAGHMTGTMATPWGNVPIEGQVRQIAQDVYNAERRHDRVTGRS